MNRIRKTCLLLSVICLVGWLGVGCAKPAPSSGSEMTKYSAEFTDLFDTVTQITGYATSEEAFTKIAEDIKADMIKLHELYDIYHTYPDVVNIKTLNDHAGKGAIKIPVELFELLEFSVKMHEQTNGRVNIAFGTVLKIWHEYRENGIASPSEAKVPTLDELKAANQHVDISQLKLNREAMTAEIVDGKVQLDVGAIAKGYATEIVANKAKQRGVKHVLLSVGGNVKAIGYRNENKDPWRIGIRNPDQQAEQKNIVLARVGESSMVTSGGYQRFYVAGGKEYCHIIDVDTLFPDTYYLSVTILIPDSGVADALSTALFNLPEAEGRKLAAKFAAEVLWVHPDKTITMTDGFKPLIINNEE